MSTERGVRMTEDKTSGLKSAFDLAMERMAQRGESMARLSEAQKKAIAETASRTKAKIAEVEILYDKKLAEARAAEDAEKVKKIEDELRAEIAKLRAKEEDEKTRIRAAG
jgi:hypothetical protein